MCWNRAYDLLPIQQSTAHLKMPSILQIINDTLPALVKLRDSGKVCTSHSAFATPDNDRQQVPINGNALYSGRLRCHACMQVKYVGFSGLPLDAFKYVLDRCAQSLLTLSLHGHFEAMH